MYVVAGIGNKGEEYEKTRHNAGRLALAQFVGDRGGAFVLSKKYSGRIWEGICGGEQVLALLPETYMNESGGSVRKAISNKESASRLIVLYDDIDLPLGAVRISFDRGSGGHRGLESVIAAVRTQKFSRVRIGISPVVGGKLRKPKDHGAMLAYVMGPFKKTEERALSEALKKAGEAVSHIVEHGVVSAMNAYNVSS